MRQIRAVAVSVTLLLAGRVATATAQGSPAARGSIIGVVRSDETDAPLAFARLRVDAGPELIARQDGGFRVDGLASGHHTMLVRQIGFAPAVREVVIDAVSGAPVFVNVRLAHLPIVLDTVRVASGVCTARGFSNVGAGDVAALFDQMALNVEQYQALSRDHPMQLRYDRRRWIVTSRGITVDARRDTVVRGPADVTPTYAPGRVLSADTDAAHRVSYNMSMPGFGDLASETFQQHHCFRYAGTVRVADQRVYRIDFVPTADLSGVDVRGAVYLDATTLLLRYAEFGVVGLPRGLTFHDVRVTATFIEVAPFYVAVQGLDATQEIDGVRTETGESVTEGKQADRLIQHTFMPDSGPKSKPPSD